MRQDFHRNHPGPVVFAGPERDHQRRVFPVGSQSRQYAVNVSCRASTCLKENQKVCQEKCQKVCQKVFQIECQKKGTPKEMLERMSQEISERMSERMSVKRYVKRMPETMSAEMSKRISEDSMTHAINVVAGVTRSNVISLENCHLVNISQSSKKCVCKIGCVNPQGSYSQAMTPMLTLWCTHSDMCWDYSRTWAVSPVTINSQGISWCIWC